MQRVNLTNEVPMDLALTALIGKPVNSTYKGQQSMFLTTDNRALYLSPEDGASLEAQLRDLGVNIGQRILICRQRSYQTGSLVTRLRVWIAGAIPIGEQSDGSFVVPRSPGASRKTTTKGPSASLVSQLVATTAVLAEAYVACLDQARDHGSRLKDEDIRALLSTAYLAMTANGVSNAA